MIAMGLLPLLLSISLQVFAHGFAGQRFFPATIAIDDPFVGDEANFQVNRFQSPNVNADSTYTTDFSFEIDKRITPDFQVSVAGDYLHITSPFQDPQNGFDNFTVGITYQVLINPDFESAVSFGVDVELGGSGSEIVDADSTSTISAILLFGQGFGALSDKVKYLRPFAITGVFSPNINETHYNNIISLDWGFVVEYSLPYLQSFVKKTKFSWFNHVIPVVEVPLNTSAGGTGVTTGSINPGILIFGKYFQLGLEGAIPINDASGSRVGGFVQLHVFTDDIFPNSLGKPLFAGKKEH